MSILDVALSRVAGAATAAASDAAAAKAEAAWRRYEPLVWLGVFISATLYVFYYLPRFKLPWQKAD